MGLFDIFSRSPEKKIAKLTKRALQKRGQPIERYQALAALLNMQSTDALPPLLSRLAFNVDPGTQDEEEKQMVFKGIVDMGKPAIPHIKNFLEQDKLVSWAVRLLEQLMERDALVRYLCEELERVSHLYMRDPAKKIELLGYLETQEHEAILGATACMLLDPNEPTRFQASRALIAQVPQDSKEDAALKPIESLMTHLSKENSLRINNLIATHAIEGAWHIPDALTEAVEDNLPPAFKRQKNVLVKA